MKNFAGETTLAEFIESGRGVPRVSDQRFRRDAHRLRAGRADGGGVRRDQRI